MNTEKSQIVTLSCVAVTVIVTVIVTVERGEEEVERNTLKKSWWCGFHISINSIVMFIPWGDDDVFLALARIPNPKG